MPTDLSERLVDMVEQSWNLVKNKIDMDKKTKLSMRDVFELEVRLGTFWQAPPESDAARGHLVQVDHEEVTVSDLWLKKSMYVFFNTDLGRERMANMLNFMKNSEEGKRWHPHKKPKMSSTMVILHEDGYRKIVKLPNPLPENYMLKLEKFELLEKHKKDEIQKLDVDAGEIHYRVTTCVEDPSAKWDVSAHPKEIRERKRMTYLFTDGRWKLEISEVLSHAKHASVRFQSSMGSDEMQEKELWKKSIKKQQQGAKSSALGAPDNAEDDYDFEAELEFIVPEDPAEWPSTRADFEQIVREFRQYVEVIKTCFSQE